MMLGGGLILVGEALVIASWVLVGYLLALAILAHAFVRYWEGPDLERRFGAAYRAYKRQVPRWMSQPPSA